MEPSPQEITQLLVKWGEGDQKVLSRLMPLVYQELRLLARHYFRRERPDHTLQVTALIHEAYLRLIDQRKVDWQNRSHFFGIAAQLMRRILVDHARQQKAAKRGEGHRPLALDEAIQVSDQMNPDLINLDDALKRLEKIDPRQSQIVELRFFGGLSIDKTAQALGNSPATVKREWHLARVWLYDQIHKGDAGGG